jgi:hypothetical protein
MATPVVAQNVTAAAIPLTAITTPVVAGGTLSGGSNMLYAALVAIRDASDWTCTSISDGGGGSGLTWTKAGRRRDTQGTVIAEIWTAFGSPGSAFTPQIDGFSYIGTVDTSVTSVTAVFIRVTGASGTVLNFVGSDSGATDTSPAINTAVISNSNSLTLNVLSTRGFTVSAADADYTEITHLTNNSAGNICTNYSYYRTTSASPGTDAISHTLSGNADWSMASLECNEDAGGGGGGSTPRTLRLLGVGS